ncbi:hypothetical protein HMPREF0663_11746 [Hoylesella oralis ATCC 33269]|uniref:Uncharacterized protein n=1 Tax=Hoylesella oralis ATCC 33269 TaxID=873533 RepID=E7RRE5_9BACT|nr:hypothetical protein HMPREF0663_11746 [Hoylesella oralis ATCC 33269]
MVYWVLLFINISIDIIIRNCNYCKQTLCQYYMGPLCVLLSTKVYK